MEHSKACFDFDSGKLEASWNSKHSIGCFDWNFGPEKFCDFRKTFHSRCGVSIWRHSAILFLCVCLFFFCSSLLFHDQHSEKKSQFPLLMLLLAFLCLFVSYHNPLNPFDFAWIRPVWMVFAEPFIPQLSFFAWHN